MSEWATEMRKAAGWCRGRWFWSEDVAEAALSRANMDMAAALKRGLVLEPAKLRNLCIAYVRSAYFEECRAGARRNRAMARAELGATEAGEEPDVPAVVDMCRAVDRGVVSRFGRPPSRLRWNEKAAWLMRDILGMSTAEVASALRQNDCSVKQMVTNVRNCIRLEGRP